VSEAEHADRLGPGAVEGLHLRAAVQREQLQVAVEEGDGEELRALWEELQVVGGHVPFRIFRGLFFCFKTLKT
jgi:hypothetical protein